MATQCRKENLHSDANKEIWLGLTQARRYYDKEYIDGAINNNQIFFFQVQ
jgi:hypothetical protein